MFLCPSEKIIQMFGWKLLWTQSVRAYTSVCTSALSFASQQPDDTVFSINRLITRATLMKVVWAETWGKIKWRKGHKRVLAGIKKFLFVSNPLVACLSFFVVLFGCVPKLVFSLELSACPVVSVWGSLHHVDTYWLTTTLMQFKADEKQHHINRLSTLGTVS